MTADTTDPLYSKLSGLLERATGQLLQPNRHWRIDSVLKPLLGRHSIPDLAVLADLLNSKADPALETECIDAMLNNETSFFRDQANFALLTGPVLDHVRQSRSDRKHIRIWSAACSTGQEPYSLAMTFADNPEKWAGWRIEIVASDVSSSALQKARGGLYSQFEIQRGLPVMLMIRHFDQIDTDWQLKESIRKRVVFRHVNVMEPRDFEGKFDVILCRNMLMYLGEAGKRKAIDNLAEAAHGDTILMLGAAETVIGQTEQFEISREFRGFYVKQGGKSAQYRMRLAS